MAVYTVRMMQDGRTVMRKQISEGLGRTDAVVLKGQAGVQYVFGEVLTNTAPQTLKVKRVGQHLHVALGKNPPEIPDLIIEDYFAYPVSPLGSLAADGAYAAYDLGAMAAGSAASTVPDGAVMQASLPVAPFGFASMGAMGWGLVGLGGLALLGGGGSGGSSAVATTVDPATTAQNKVMAYAADGTATAPALTDYTAIGVTGVTAANLAAINSAVDALAGTAVDTKAKLQAVVDAYVKILAEANGSAVTDVTPGSNPVASDYAAIGADIGLAATQATALNLLNDVIGPVSTTSGLASTAVDTVAEINALAAVVTKIMNTAAGTPAALTVADLALLGLATVGAGAVNSNNVAAINSALGTAGGQTRVDSMSELITLVTAVATIANYAEDNSQAVPTLAHYTAVGVTGVTASNLSSINSAVDANSAVALNTQAKLQELVDAYVFVLAEANVSNADATPGVNPTAVQYSTMGASIGAAASDTENLALLNDAIGEMSSTSVDTITKINDLASAANAVMTGAAGGVRPTAAQLALLLGSSLGVTTDNLNAVQNAIAATADSGVQVDSRSELIGVVNTGVTQASSSQAVITAYANLNTNLAPSLSNYDTIGVTGVTVGNLAAINSAVDALIGTQVDSRSEVQAVVTAYTKILAEANGVAVDATPGVDPTGGDYAAIGANVGLAALGAAGGADLSSSALSLINSALAGLAPLAVDSIAKIDALAVKIDKVMNLAALTTGSAIPGSTVTMADLNDLGVSTTSVNTVLEQNAILQAVIDSPDTGSGVQTILALQAIVNAHAA